MIIGNNTKYSLDIVSLDKEVENRSLKKFNIDDIDFVGVHENEPFEIRFKNNTHKRVQVRISVDGTDVLSGDTAGTDPVGEMWMVNAYCNLKLQAWPESNKGGARFLFTNTDSSVAANTHGDLSSKGVIAVAVFEEGHNPFSSGHFTLQGSTMSSSGGDLNFNASSTSATLDGNFTKTSSSVSHDSNEIRINSGNGVDYSCGEIKTLSLDEAMAKRPEMYKSSEGKSLSRRRRSRIGGKKIKASDIKADAAVGAGEFVEQTLSRVAGLTEPILASTLLIRYKWWNSLRSELRKIGKANATNGFPADAEKRLDLGETPRIKSSAKRPSRRSRGRRKYVELNRFV